VIYSKSGDIPTHQYCYVERKYITNGEMNGTESCVWFGIVAYTGRVWGCQIMLKSGAVYREVPIHALSFTAVPESNWTPFLAQQWDCVPTRGGLQDERIWMNYRKPVDLHDYAYIGDGRRSRERIRRRQKNWREQLLKMPEQERLAMLEVLNNSLKGD